MNKGEASTFFTKKNKKEPLLSDVFLLGNSHNA